LKERVIDYIISFIEKYHKYSNKDLEKLRYGLEGLYLTITKMIVIISLSIYLGIFKETIITLFLFNIIRYTGFGFHAEKSWHCLILSTIYFIGIPLFFLHVQLSDLIILSICFLCIISYLLFAPADTKKRPLPNKKKRKIRKFATFFIGIIYSIMIFIINDTVLTALLLSTLVVQAIIIQPLLYKIFQQPYNNYKSYVKV